MIYVNHYEQIFGRALYKSSLLFVTGRGNIPAKMIAQGKLKLNVNILSSFQLDVVDVLYNVMY